MLFKILMAFNVIISLGIGLYMGMDNMLTSFILGRETWIQELLIGGPGTIPTGLAVAFVVSLIMMLLVSIIIFVFLASIEFIVANYIQKRRRHRRLKRPRRRISKLRKEVI